MPYIANLRSISNVPVVCAHSGEKVQECIALALILVAKPQTAYAYFDHNGVIITLDKTSTAESAYQDWSQRAAIANNTFCDAVGTEEPRPAQFTIRGERQEALTRYGQPVPESEQLYVIWKVKGGPIPCDEYLGGYGYAGHLPTDKGSAEWHAEQATERIKAQYWQQQDVVFDVVLYQPEK